MSTLTATTASLKLMPSDLIKNVRATAALVVLDLLFQQDSMNEIEKCTFAYNAFHGNAEKNYTSQIRLLFEAHGKYASLYKEEFFVLTDRNHQNDDDQSNKAFVVKSLFSKVDDISNYTANVNFTIESLSAPTKSKLKEKITGRNIIDLASTALKNLKKAIAIVQEFLLDGELPSGTTWDDLYQFVLSKNNEIHDGKGIFVGFVAFVTLSEYNDQRENHLISLLSVNDSDMDEGRVSARKKAKTQKDFERSVEVGNIPSPFSERVSTIFECEYYFIT